MATDTAVRERVAMILATHSKKELAAQLVATITMYEERAIEVQRLTREIDVAINGEEGAAKQASLCDILGQLWAERK